MSRHPTIWERKGRGYWTTIRKRQEFLGRTKAEAKAKFAELMARGPQAPGQHTVHDLIVIYLEWFGSQVARGENSIITLRNYRQSLQCWDQFCTVKPDEMRAYHVTQWIAANPQWNATSANSRVRHVKIWADFCESEGYIESNRMRRAKSPTPLKRQPTDPANFARMERTITDPCFLRFFHVLYDTGARPGEIATLTADRVNWSTSSPVVIGKSGERLIGLTSRALGILREHAKPVLMTRFGSAWNNDSICKTWKKWKELAGCSDPCTAYHARHDLDRRLNLAGVDSVTISRQLGHTLRGAPNLSLLASTYSHRDGAVLARALDSAASSSRPAIAKR